MSHLQKIQSENIRFKILWFISKHLAAGKSIHRALLHYKVQSLKLKGAVLDLGAGSSQPSYLEFLNKSYDHITFTDLKPKDKHILQIDLEKPFDLKKKYDSILCFNLLEHLFHPEIVLSSSLKHLKSKGKLYGLVPYIHPYHQDPEDYFRYSHVALQTLLIQAGFKKITITYLGVGPIVAAFALIASVLPRIVRVPFFGICVLLDVTLLRFSKMFSQKYALSYFFEAST